MTAGLDRPRYGVGREAVVPFRTGPRWAAWSQALLDSWDRRVRGQGAGVEGEWNRLPLNVSIEGVSDAFNWVGVLA